MLNHETMKKLIVITLLSQAHQTAEAARQSGATSGQTQRQPEDFILPAARAGHVSINTCIDEKGTLHTHSKPQMYFNRQRFDSSGIFIQSHSNYTVECVRVGPNK